MNNLFYFYYSVEQCLKTTDSDYNVEGVDRFGDIWV